MTSPLTQGLLPPPVVVVATTKDIEHLDRAQALSALPEASAGRLREFATARLCARLALRLAGSADTAVARAPSRAPRWPTGFVGSITHCSGFRAAAVARASAVLGVGIDAEPDAAVPAGVLDAITDPAEREHLCTLPTGLSWDRLLFSAKESVYKVWSPITGRWLGFTDARMRFVPDNGLDEGAFHAHLVDVTLPVPGARPLSALAGRYRRVDGILLTAITLPAPTPTSCPAGETAGRSGPWHLTEPRGRTDVRREPGALEQHAVGLAEARPDRISSRPQPSPDTTDW